VKDINEVIKQKKVELMKIQTEIDMLTIVLRMLAEPSDPQPVQVPVNSGIPSATAKAQNAGKFP
jgi:hypothetical protein